MEFSQSMGSNGRGAGCLILFALPFAAVGVGATWWCAHIVSQHAAMQSWVERPAFIKKIALKENHGEGTTYQVTAVYEYEFGGRRFTGERVSIGGGSNNIGNFHRAAYQELKQHKDQGKPFRCYVDPNNPSDAVLYRDLRGEMLAFFTLFGTTFGSVGIGLITAAIIGARRASAAKVEEAPPDKPWLARSDWATGQIRSSGGASTALTVVAVLVMYWNIASLPLYRKLPEVFDQVGFPWNWLVLIFPAIGALLIVLLLYHVIQRRKFGESWLQFASTPGVVGGQLAGVVRTSKPVPATEGFRIQLSCFDWVSDGDSRTKKALWQDERHIMEPMRGDFGEGTVVPVLFAIPIKCLESARPDSTTGVHWQLQVSAKLPGVDYKAQFDVPVFKTAESRADFKLDPSLDADYAPPPPRDLLLAEAGLVKELLPGGVRLVLPAMRNPIAALGAALFLAIWSTAIWAMIRSHAPIFLPIVFGLLDLVILLITLDQWFYRGVIEAGRDGLTFRGGLFGIGRKRSWQADEIKRFSTRESMSAGTKVWKNIVVVTQDGKQPTIARSISGKLAQQAVIDELEAGLGKVSVDKNKA
jgi:hypothetical protein